MLISSFIFLLQKRTNLNIEQAKNAILEKVRDKILEEISQPDSSLTYSHLGTVLTNSKQAAVEEVLHRWSHTIFQQTRQ